MTSANPFDGSRIITFVAEMLVVLERSDSPVEEVKEALAMIRARAITDPLTEALRDHLQVKYGAELGLQPHEIEAAQARFSAALMEEMLAARLDDGEDLGDVFADVHEQAHEYAIGEGRRH